MEPTFAFVLTECVPTQLVARGTVVYFEVMNAIARELDAKLQTLDVAKAAVLVRVVRDALELATGADPPLASWPAGFFDRIREDWGTEPFARPPQGEFEIREDW